MVDVEVFNDQLDEKHLDAKTEARIRKLLKNAKIITQQQAIILQGIIDGTIKDLSKIDTLDQALIYATINPFLTTIAVAALIPYQDNIGKIFNMGIKFSNDKPSNTVKQLEENVKQSTQQYITKLGEDLKTKAGNIVADGISKRIPVNDVVARLERELNISRARANTIARTETMRAAHAGSYGQAIRDGKSYYIVDSRAEACVLCKREYLGKIFDINDIRNMPPLHPNCACIPVYFNSSDEASRWADKIGFDIQKQVEQIEKSGVVIPKDGTGRNSNR